MNKVKEDTERNLRNQDAAIKNLETQVGNLDGEVNLKIKHCMECTLCFIGAVKFDKFNGAM